MSISRPPTVYNTYQYRYLLYFTLKSDPPVKMATAAEAERGPQADLSNTRIGHPAAAPAPQVR